MLFFLSLYPIDSVSLDRVKSGDIHIYIYLFHSFFADVLPSAFLPLYVGSAYITLKTSLKSLCWFASLNLVCVSTVPLARPCYPACCCPLSLPPRPQLQGRDRPTPVHREGPTFSECYYYFIFGWGNERMFRTISHLLIPKFLEGTGFIQTGECISTDTNPGGLHLRKRPHRESLNTLWVLGGTTAPIGSWSQRSAVLRPPRAQAHETAC